MTRSRRPAIDVVELAPDCAGALAVTTTVHPTSEPRSASSSGGLVVNPYSVGMVVVSIDASEKLYLTVQAF